MTLSELAAQGVEKMRLPFWNRHAYATPNKVGPWVMVYDVLNGVDSGKPVAVLISMCDEHDTWEPFPDNQTEGAT